MKQLLTLTINDEGGIQISDNVNETQINQFIQNPPFVCKILKIADKE